MPTGCADPAAVALHRELTSALAPAGSVLLVNWQGEQNTAAPLELHCHLAGAHEPGVWKRTKVIRAGWLPWAVSPAARLTTEPKRCPKVTGKLHLAAAPALRGGLAGLGPENSYIYSSVNRGAGLAVAKGLRESWKAGGEEPSRPHSPLEMGPGGQTACPWDTPPQVFLTAVPTPGASGRRLHGAGVSAEGDHSEVIGWVLVQGWRSPKKERLGHRAVSGGALAGQATAIWRPGEGLDQASLSLLTSRVCHTHFRGKA